MSADLKEVERLVSALRNAAMGEGHPLGGYQARRDADEAEADLLAEFRKVVEENEKDAVRYRWLCETLGQTQLPCLIERITKDYVADYKPSIDTAIDSAMASSVEGEKS